MKKKKKTKKKGGGEGHYTLPKPIRSRRGVPLFLGKVSVGIVEVRLPKDRFFLGKRLEQDKAILLKSPTAILEYSEATASEKTYNMRKRKEELTEKRGQATGRPELPTSKMPATRKGKGSPLEKEGGLSLGRKGGQRHLPCSQRRSSHLWGR